MRRHCETCLYIGPAENCSCRWTLQKVAEGKGSDPDVVRNAQSILRTATRGAWRDPEGKEDV